METITSIFMGVLGGILTSVIIFIGVYIFQKIIVPWYEGVIYKGINLSGTWIRNFEQEEGQFVEARFHIKQKGHHVSGIEEWSLKDSKGNLIDSASFKLQGEVYDRLVNIYSKNIDRRRFGYLIFLLQVVKDGSEMRGKAVYYDTTVENQIVTVEANLIRQEKVLQKIQHVSKSKALEVSKAI